MDSLVSCKDWIEGCFAQGCHIDHRINAVLTATEIVRYLETMKIAMRPRLGRSSHFIARIEAAAEGLSNPEYCEIEIDRHLVVPETAESCQAQYQKICHQMIKQLNLPPVFRRYVKITVELKKRTHGYMKAYETSQKDPFAKLAKRLITKEQNNVIINYGRSVGDENIFASELGIKPIIVGPEEGNMHSPNEWEGGFNLNTNILE